MKGQGRCVRERSPHAAPNRRVATGDWTTVVRSQSCLDTGCCYKLRSSARKSDEVEPRESVAVNRMSRQSAAIGNVEVMRVLRDRQPRPFVSRAMRLLAAIGAILIVVTFVTDAQIPPAPLGRAAISGRVVDGFGDPIVHARVVVEVRTGPGEIRAVAAGEADDRGEYRIGRLPAGKPFGRREQSLNGVEVIVTDRITELSGTMVAADTHGAPAAAVIVFSTDRSRWYPESRFMRKTTAGSDGAFSVAGLPFGSYYVAAVASLPVNGPNDWQDPAFLETLVFRASTVTLAEGRKETIKLELPSR
jgi:hypothetical protein